MREASGQLTVEVRDDGKGFDPVAASDGHGFGLAGMRERVELAGGTLDLQSSPGATVLRARLPVRRRAGAPDVLSGADQATTQGVANELGA